MSGWALATWAAIVVLIGGSTAVLLWFLRDAVRWLRRHKNL